MKVICQECNRAFLSEYNSDLKCPHCMEKGSRKELVFYTPDFFLDLAKKSYCFH